ncbi:ABC transporter permease subunit [Patescibacteria group bacterium]|nr:ABC transporter permease subunit [Patescibacteria group bacterium]
MKPETKIIHHRHHSGISYGSTRGQRFYSAFVMPLVLFGVLFLALNYFSKTTLNVTTLTFAKLSLALGATFLRLSVAYIFSLAAAFFLVFLIYYSPRAEEILLPLYDITESVPTLAFFPVIILLFIRFGFFNGAAIFILFLSMLWNIVFSLVGGLSTIPADLKSAAEVFGIRGWMFVKKVLLPALVPQLVTGSLLAWAQGWNIIIVAEVLHTYIPGGTPAQDVFGIGSALVNASASGQSNVFFVAILLMILAIALLNFLVWQKLLQYAERYKFD